MLFEISDLKMIEECTFPIKIQLNEVVSKKDLEIMLKHPWILLQVCTAYFNDFLCQKNNKEDVFCETMFFSEDELDD